MPMDPPRHSGRYMRREDLGVNEIVKTYNGFERVIWLSCEVRTWNECKTFVYVDIAKGSGMQLETP